MAKREMASQKNKEMKINHIAIWASDIEKTKDFFTSYFNATLECNQYHNTRTGFRSYFLGIGEGCKLEIMSNSNKYFIYTENTPYGLAHLAFSVGCQENVDKLTSRLAHDTYKIITAPRITGDGYYESCIEGPDGILIEITI